MRDRRPSTELQASFMERGTWTLRRPSTGELEAAACMMQFLVTLGVWRPCIALKKFGPHIDARLWWPFAVPFKSAQPRVLSRAVSQLQLSDKQ